jgi:hypothetical protein
MPGQNGNRNTDRWPLAGVRQAAIYLYLPFNHPVTSEDAPSIQTSVPVI